MPKYGVSRGGDWSELIINLNTEIKIIIKMLEQDLKEMRKLAM